jgi:hypothetical protein
LRLWIESAHQSLVRTGAEVCGAAVSTLQSEDQFFAVVVSGAGKVEGGAAPIVNRAAAMLEHGATLDAVVETLLAGMPKGEHVPLSMLQVLGGSRACLVDCDAPPLFMIRSGQLVVLPVIEEESHGHLMRTCEFLLQDGDHIAMVSEGYIQAKGWSRQWGWRDIAISIRRLTDTRCDAEQLLGALVRSYERLAQGEAARDVGVVAMFVRPLRSATVWSGPPAQRKLDKDALDMLMAEPGARIICGDTTAEIAARLSGAILTMEPPSEDGWEEVPPVSRMERVSLVTEGVVTLGQTRVRIAEARRARDLPRKEDGATRLAQMLLTADKIRFLVGLAINPAQVADKAGHVPMRRIVIEGLMNDLKARGKIVSVEYF